MFNYSDFVNVNLSNVCKNNISIIKKGSVQNKIAYTYEHKHQTKYS